MMIELVYNGKSYDIKDGDIPNLSGEGTITIIKTATSQSQRTCGNFSSIIMSQDEHHCYINGANIEKLIKKIEDEKSKGIR